jgi:hypothetical protein
MKEIDIEKIYFGSLALFVAGVVVYKYFKWGCVLICLDNF